MPNYSIRGIPADVHAVLEREAKRTHRSLNALVTSVLTDYVAEVRRRRRMKKSVEKIVALRERIEARRGLTSDSGELLAEDRQR